VAKKKAPERFSLSGMLRDSIKKRELTAYAVSQETGIHVTIIGRFLTGKRGLTFASADKIIDALGIRYEEVGTIKRPKSRVPRPST
jgi:plasmid maintenance system antidote protein VapI